MADVIRWLNASTSSRDEEMFAGLYAELHKIARGRMAGERPEETLEATGLVHEAWLRLEKSAPEEWQNRKHFYGARRRVADKRGGGEGAVPLDEALPLPSATPDERLLAVHEVLDQLEKEYEMDAQIVKLRFFGGLMQDEIAALLEVSEKTVQRHWIMAKTWLYQALQE